MKARYDAEDINSRPLPPVRVEVRNGVEDKSVRDILDRIRSVPSVPGLLSLQSPLIVPSVTAVSHLPFNNNVVPDQRRYSGGGGFNDRDINRSGKDGYNSRDNFNRDRLGKRSRDEFDRDDTPRQNRRWSSGPGFPNDDSFRDGGNSNNNNYDGDNLSSKSASTTPTVVEKKRSAYFDLDAPKVMNVLSSMCIVSISHYLVRLLSQCNTSASVTVVVE